MFSNEPTTSVLQCTQFATVLRLRSAFPATPSSTPPSSRGDDPSCPTLRHSYFLQTMSLPWMNGHGGRVFPLRPPTPSARTMHGRVGGCFPFGQDWCRSTAGRTWRHWTPDSSSTSNVPLHIARQEASRAARTCAYKSPSTHRPFSRANDAFSGRWFSTLRSSLGYGIPFRP